MLIAAVRDPAPFGEGIGNHARKCAARGLIGLLVICASGSRVRLNDNGRDKIVLKRDFSQSPAGVADRAVLDDMLAAAHGKLEKKFLEGGAVLIAISDILKKLLGSLDNLTTSLDGQTTTETIERFQSTARELAALPSFEHNRQQGFERLATLCKAMQGSVEEMRDTMRYLRTFAVTVKITGAGLAEFAGFADEIRERIQSGSDEVNKFATQLAAMYQQLRNAELFSAKISSEYSDVVPRIVAELEENAGKVAEHHRNLATLANEVKALARGIQMKVATVLSALQIGDITRQRIEHIRSSFELFDAFRQSDEGAGLGEASLALVDGAISQLAAAQMEEIVGDFQRECRKIMENMSRFVDDARAILELRDQMSRHDGGGDTNFLAILETNVAAASKLVENVHETSIQADAVAQSTSQTAQSLLQGIEIIRSIKTDIHYMALNSNLRCSKLGDEGRSVNVVSAELRFFAEKLDEPAGKVLNDLHGFEAAATDLMQQRGSGTTDISRPLNEALAAISDVSRKMEADIEVFEQEGQEVFSRVSAAIATLDFESELGDVLMDCVTAANSLAATSPAGDLSDLAGQVAGLGSKIYRTYTMASERDIHRQFFPVEDGGEETAAAPAVQSDEDLFEDALF